MSPTFLFASAVPDAPPPPPDGVEDVAVSLIFVVVDGKVPTGVGRGCAVIFAVGRDQGKVVVVVGNICAVAVIAVVVGFVVVVVGDEVVGVRV